MLALYCWYYTRFTLVLAPLIITIIISKYCNDNY